MLRFDGPAAGRVLEAVRGLATPFDATLAACTWVPPAGPGVCAACHAACAPARPRCRTCARTAAQVSRPVPGVVPISLFRTGDQLWRLLRAYKDGGDAGLRRDCRRRLARLLSQYLRFHLACLTPELAGRPWGEAAGKAPGEAAGPGTATGGWALTTVPPTRPRPGRYPLEGVIGWSPWLRRRCLRTLATARPPEHNRASDDAFRVIGPVAGRDLVLLDDTFTTGASVQSAASALQGAGARVLAVVVLGRVLNPDRIPDEAALWEVATRQRFRLEVCCCGAHGTGCTGMAGRRAQRQGPGKLLGTS